MSQSRSGSGSCSPAIKASHARRSDNYTLVNSPDYAGQLASAKITFQHTQGFRVASLKLRLSSSSLFKLRFATKKNHWYSIGNELGAHQGEMDFDEDEYESSIESSFCSGTQMSLSAISSNSNNMICRIEQLGKKLEALISSHQMLQFKAKSRLKIMASNQISTVTVCKRLKRRGWRSSVLITELHTESLCLNQMIILF